MGMGMGMGHPHPKATRSPLPFRKIFLFFFISRFTPHHFFIFFRIIFFKNFFLLYLGYLFCVLRRCFVLVVYFIVCYICVEIWGISRRFRGCFNVFVDYCWVFLMFCVVKKA
jgi:hypothetical protein